MELGDVGVYDADYANRHAPWIGRLFDRYFRTDVEGLDRVPDRPFVSVGNHNGSVMMPDLVVWMSHYHRLGRATKLLALSHDLIFSLPPARLSTALAKLGAIRATRDNALKALERGFAIHAYPGGDYDAAKAFRERHTINFAGHSGYARVALRAGVPIVPVVSVGAHEILYIFTDGSKLSQRLGLDRSARLKVLPIMALLPWGMWVGIPPGFLPLPSQISLRVLDPIEPSDFRDGDEDATVARVDLEVRTRMQTALTEMAQGRIPVLGRLRRKRLAS